MKKALLILATVALSAACAKTEVINTISDAENEISFNVAPLTKATTAFSTDNVFVAQAYYLGAGKTWDANKGEASLYISKSTISNVDGTWKNATTPYYWPKDGGKLTFFAYSFNTNTITPEGAPTVNITPNNGVVATVTPSENNIDFLVADIAKDQVQGATGVATIFRHKLAKVQVKAKLAADYTNKAFAITGISFSDLNAESTYTQSTENWQADDVNVFTYLATGNQAITSTDAEVIANGTTLYIPQTFGDTSDAKLTVNYTITTTVGETPVVEECSKVIDMKDIVSAFAMGKVYTINLTFSLNEITWVPEVEDWAYETYSAPTIE